LIPTVRTTTVERSLKAASRIVLDVDPSASPGEVEAAFQSARRRLVGDRRRFRNPADNRLRLAIFCAERDGTPAELRRKWNRAHPDDQFETLAAFTRALDRVNGQLLDLD
jgi:hypothetical protein